MIAGARIKESWPHQHCRRPAINNTILWIRFIIDNLHAIYVRLPDQRHRLYSLIALPIKGISQLIERKPKVESMVNTRASSCNLSNSDPQSESIALLTAPDTTGPSSLRTPQDDCLDLADKAEILEERLKALQHKECIARLKQKVSE